MDEAHDPGAPAATDTTPTRRTMVGRLSGPTPWAARGLGLVGAGQAAYGAAALILDLRNATAWHHVGYISGYRGGALLALGVGVVATAVAAVASRGSGVSWQPRRTWQGALALVAGLVTIGYGAYAIGACLWYDLTFEEQGGVGASFAVIGVWFGRFLCFPVGAALVAAGLGHRPATAPRR